MGFPARHDNGSLNRRPGTWCSGSSGSMTSVTVDVEGRVLAGIVVLGGPPEDGGLNSGVLLLVEGHSGISAAYSTINMAGCVIQFGV